MHNEINCIFKCKLCIIIYITFICKQFTLTVVDNGSPKQSSSIPVTINVIRDLQDPVFNPDFMVVPMSYLANINDVLVTVNATDADTNVSSH